MREFLHTVISYAELRSRVDLSHIAKGGFWLSLNQGANILFGLLSSVVIANILSTVEYGVYRYILTAATIIATFSLSGMNVAITRAVATGQESLVRASFWYQLKWNILGIIISIGVSGYYILQSNITLGVGIFLAVIFLAVSGAANTFSAYLIGKEDYRRLFFYTISIGITTSTALIATAIFFTSALPFVIAFFVSSTVGNVIAFFHSTRRIQSQTAMTTDIKSYGLHLSIINILSAFASNVDKLLVFQSLGATPLAVYYLATLLPAQIGGAAKVISTLALPRLSQRFAAGNKLHYKHKMLLLMTTVAIIVITYIVLAPFIYQILFPKYLDSIPYSQVISLIFIFIAPTLYLLSILQSGRHTKQIYLYTAFSATFQIVMMVVLISLWALWGLVAAHGLSSIVNFCLALYFVRHTQASSERK